MLRKLLALSALLVLLLTSSVIAQDALDEGMVMEDATEDAQSVLDAEQAEAEAEPVGDMVLVDSAFDTEPELDGRTLVVAIHGVANDYLDVTDEVHASWSAFEVAAGIATVGGEGRRQKTKFTYLNYSPTKPMEEIADDFVALMGDRFPGVSPVLVAHSGGARIAAIASTLMPVKALIEIASARNGTQGASLMLASSNIGDKIGEEHVATLEAARARWDISDDVLRSLAWTNEDGSISSEDQSTYGIPVGSPIEVTARIYSHYGTMENYRPDLVSLVTNGIDQETIDQDKAEWEALGAFSDDWDLNDGIVAPMDEPGDTEDGGKVRFYGNVRHAEMLFNPLVLSAVVKQIDEAAGLEPVVSDIEDVENEDEPEEDNEDEDEDEDDTADTEDGDDEADTDDEEDEDDGKGTKVNGNRNVIVNVHGNNNTVNIDLPGMQGNSNWGDGWSDHGKGNRKNRKKKGKKSKKKSQDDDEDEAAEETESEEDNEDDDDDASGSSDLMDQLEDAVGSDAIDSWLGEDD